MAFCDRAWPGHAWSLRSCSLSCETAQTVCYLASSSTSAPAMVSFAREDLLSVTQNWSVVVSFECFKPWAMRKQLTTRHISYIGYNTVIFNSFLTDFVRECPRMNAQGGEVQKTIQNSFLPPGDPLRFHWGPLGSPRPPKSAPGTSKRF